MNRIFREADEGPYTTGGGDLPAVPTVMEGEKEDEFIQKHLLKVMDMTADSMIQSELGRMYDGLEMASVEYFVKTGTVNGSFHQRLKKIMIQFAQDWHSTAIKINHPL